MLHKKYQLAFNYMGNFLNMIIIIKLKLKTKRLKKSKKY